MCQKIKNTCGPISLNTAEKSLSPTIKLELKQKRNLNLTKNQSALANPKQTLSKNVVFVKPYQNRWPRVQTSKHGILYAERYVPSQPSKEDRITCRHK